MFFDASEPKKLKLGDVTETTQAVDSVSCEQPEQVRARFDRLPTFSSKCVTRVTSD